MKMPRLGIVPFVLGLLAVLAFGIFCLQRTEKEISSSPSESGKVLSGIPKLQKGKPSPSKDKTKPLQDESSETEADDGDGLTPQERHLCDAIQDGLDDNDFKKVAAQLKKAAASTNVAVRAKAVEALQWFGEDALPELTMFMADEDDDVRTTAIDAWTMGLSRLDAGDEKAMAVKFGLRVVLDRDRLESMVLQVDNLATDQKLAVLADVIEGSNKIAAEVAREHYKFWTEEDYVDRATAQKWLDANSEAEE